MKINIQEQLDRAFTFLQSDDPQKWNDAENIYNAILNIDKGSAPILYSLGTLYMKKKFITLAIILFKKALELDSTLFSAWNNLGYAYREDRQIELSREAFEKATKLNPSDVDCWMNLGAMWTASGEPKKAIEYTNKALEIKPDNPHAMWNRSLAYLECGNFIKGWQDFEARMKTGEDKVRQYHNFGTPLWDGTKGQTVVVYGEQGIGDEIMFASMIADLAKDCKVIIDAHPRLYQLFRQSFPEVTVYGTRKDDQLVWPELHKIDACLAMGSLGKFYRNQLSDFPATPYLVADPKRVAKYTEKLATLSPRMKIGISWKGGTKMTNAGERNIPLATWLPLFKAIDADFISLQYTDNAQEQLDKFEQEHGIKIHHWQDCIADYDETAGLVSALDFVVSVPQSVVHLAGALGVPTIQLTPKRAMWQMGTYGNNMPWYCSVKNIWQDESQTWEPVINKAKEELCNLYQMSISA